MHRHISALMRTLCAILISSVLVADDALAQSGSLFGNRGPVSRSNVGFGNSGFGTGASSTGFGSLSNPGSRGGSPFGGGGLGQSAFVNAGAFSAGGMNQAFGSGFVGAADRRNSIFDSSRTGRAGSRSRRAGNTGSRRSRRFQQRGGESRRGGDRRRGEAPNTRAANGPRGGRSMPVIQPRQRVAFSYPRPPASAIRTSLEARFRRLSHRSRGDQQISIETNEENGVTLRGSVDSEQARRFAAALARLEPGVRSIHNELKVREPIPAEPE